jgi:predicted transcriptional regulator
MENNIKFELKHATVENINAFAQILKKDPNTILEEALEQYFENEQQKLIEKSQNDENAMTNLDYDEFWDGVDLD